MTRNGKIARLPKLTRDCVNARLQDGEPGPQILQWLNSLPETQDMLESLFDSRPINEQNLSEWRQGGYQDWLRDQQTSERVQRLSERAQDIDRAANGVGITDRLASVVAVELADAVEKLSEIADANERWRRLQEILRELQRLRSEDHKAGRLHMEQTDWRKEKEREKEKEEERAANEEKRELVKVFWANHHRPLVAQSLGGGEYGKKWAEWLFCIENNRPMPEWWEKRNRGTNVPEEIRPIQTESNQIKPVQTESDTAQPNTTPGQRPSPAPAT